MAWWRRSSEEEPPLAPRDVAERLRTVRQFPRRVEADTVPVSDVQTVRAWLRELARDEMVFVHRPWGTVTVDGDDRHPVGVILSDGERTWTAHPPGGDAGSDLTREQVEHVVVAALTSDQRPPWPAWRRLS